MNVVRNTWKSPAKARSRTVTVEIETTKPAGVDEFELMARLTAVVDTYMADQEPT